MQPDSMNYLHAELKRLDLLLHRQILRLRATHQLSMDEFRGLYISDQQVDELIKQVAQSDEQIPSTEQLACQAEELHQANLSLLAVGTPWKHLIDEFELNRFEQDVLLLSIAPELQLKYETLYAYLNNDVSRKWPTHELALSLFSNSSEEGDGLRGYLLPEAKLYSSGLLRPIQPAPERPWWLATGFSVSTSILRYLSGALLKGKMDTYTRFHVASTDWSQLHIAASLLIRLKHVPRLFQETSTPFQSPLVIMEGPYGSEKKGAAHTICKQLGRGLIEVDIQALYISGQPLQQAINELILYQHLSGAGIYLNNIAALFDKENRPSQEALGAVRQLGFTHHPVFVACEPGTSWRELFQHQRVLLFHFPYLDYSERLQAWQSCLDDRGIIAPRNTLEAVADRFILTPGQIQDAVTSIINHAILDSDGSAQTMNEDVLFEAARNQSSQQLGSLAVKVDTKYTWEDLVLPETTRRQVREVAAAIRNRHLVYSQWGFNQRMDWGQGLKMLFSGTSGTGKTMTAGIIANDLGLDMYKIDLSGIVSKYIGETEKNLNKIFRAAHSSNAILFFDEADALFGKRSEVKDAHDRYANIEVAYLLQKIEEHEGAVILATNLSRNIDQAFSRRMHYVVEFPLPDEAHREKLWRGMFPTGVPLGEDVNFSFLARQFQLSGGDIRNIALSAAFLAAENGRVITMEQLAQATARQLIKQGKIPTATDFKQYFPLLVQRH